MIKVVNLLLLRGFMAKGFALNLGLNKINPQHYGSDGALRGCVNDANDMTNIAQEQGFITTQLINEKATRSNVIQAIQNASVRLSSGDIFFISFSGHGGQVPDLNQDEDDYLDETWCLYDAQLIDDELKLLWSYFNAGVRILVISDSCHSGTITKRKQLNNLIQYSNQKPRYLPYADTEKVWENNKTLYIKISNTVAEQVSEIKASVLLLSGCQDNQLSYDGEKNGAFTSQLLRVWDGGRFRGNYQKFYQKILVRMPAYQSPNYYLIGSGKSQFFQNRGNPFKI